MKELSHSVLTGPTLSTSTSSFEALDPHDPNLSRLATSMFQKTADYLFGELASTQEDYRLLEAMNQATIIKYSDMKQIASNVARTITDLNEKYKSLQPYLEQIDQIEDSVVKLEQAAYKLDAYSKRLETKFKHLEKR
ncbi:hypothetical protein PR048_001427 [Dryococelus australis]|uniref:Biogenesis of lysosome-related organelles complex 1 subunit 2 n=1 Tax=Dryococelus australis TaxID=614101 RepID=A0ABQ9IHB8_9NEOP|nr:hypothetical protein PR048_001427 [Dryococelus australis]